MLEVDLKKFPAAPGVYLMKGPQGEVLYVGKAKHLRNRLRSYFSVAGDGRAHIRFLMNRVAAVDTLVTDTEKEALILENTLIKEHRPRYNINLRDDKTYVSLRIDLREEFPALQLVRRVKKDGARYFGPYSSGSAVRETLKLIYRIFPLRHQPLENCRRRERPCLYHQIGQCSAPCHDLIGPEAYRTLVHGAVALLSGRENEVLGVLRKRMSEAAERFDYELAARLRDQIRAIEQTVEQQKVADAGGGDQDVVGIHRQEGEVELAILFVREGKVIDRRSYSLEWRLDEDELLSSFLREFYSREVVIPDRLLLPLAIEDAATLESWLSERKGRRVRLLVPRRGGSRQLVELARRNAEEVYREKGSRREARRQLLQDVAQRLHLGRFPRRIECFDVSNVQGAHSVASMAVLKDGEPDKAAYRHYRIRTVAGADDYASLYEVLKRRLHKGLEEGELPDMILIDGGKGQLAVLTAVLDELSLTGRVDAVGIAKSRVCSKVRGKTVERSEERFFLPGRKNPVVLRQGAAALFMLERLRDEAHRFAITHHRKLRRKATLHSALEEIPGIGPERRKALLRHFGSLKQVRQATPEQLEAVPGLPKPLAQRLYASLHDQSDA